MASALLLVSSEAKAQEGANRLKAVEVRQEGEGLVIFVSAERSVTAFRDFTLENPERIAIDLYGLQSPFKGEQRLEVAQPQASLLRHFGHPDRVRLVVHTQKEFLKAYRAEPTEGGLMIRIGRPAAPAATPGTAVEQNALSAKAAARGDAPPAAPKAQLDKAAKAAAGREQNGVNALRIEDVRVRSAGGRLVIHLVAEGPITEYTSRALSGPSRIEFEIENVRAPSQGARRIPVKDPLAKAVSYAGSGDRLRLTVETDRTYRSGVSSFSVENGLVIAIDGSGPLSRPLEAAAAKAEPAGPIAAAAHGRAPAAGSGPAARGKGAEAAAAAEASPQPADEGKPHFAIKAIEVTGNTVLAPQAVQAVVAPFTGPKRTAEDVEQAREALEKHFHDQGYPTVLVNIPEQSVENGVVRLEVVEARISRVRVTGNKYFTMAKILKELPSLREGELLYLPRVQEELAGINRNPDIKVAPVLSPGREPGTIEVELKVKDQLALHGSAELSNRNTHDTTDLRLNTQLRYDNLWQRDHSVSLQFQTAPQNTDEVMALAGSYVLPAPWGGDQILALYGLYTDSNTAFGAGFATVGKGWIVGFRNVFPLPAVGSYAHNLSAGMDYKQFDDELSLEEQTGTKTTIRYMPLSLAYNSSLRDRWGATQFSSGLNLSFRGLAAEQEKFQEKRFESRGNYLYLTLGLERTQPLPGGFAIFGKVDGQIADQPLISNEQYLAGGLRSVRGYKETEVAGDNALHHTLEFSLPDLFSFTRWKERMGLIPYVFHDWALLKVKSALPGEDDQQTIQGVGAGVRGFFTRNLEFELAWGYALRKTDRTDEGDSDLYFVMKGQF